MPRFVVLPLNLLMLLKASAIFQRQWLQDPVDNITFRIYVAFWWLGRLSIYDAQR